MTTYRDVEREKEAPFVVPDHFSMETETPEKSPAMSSPVKSSVSHPTTQSKSAPVLFNDSSSSSSAQSSLDAPMSAQNASSSAVPSLPPLSDVRICCSVFFRRATRPRLFVTNTFTFSNTPLLYTHTFSSSAPRSPDPIRPAPSFAAKDRRPAFPPLSAPDRREPFESPSKAASVLPSRSPAPA